MVQRSPKSRIKTSVYAHLMNKYGVPGLGIRWEETEERTIPMRTARPNLWAAARSSTSSACKTRCSVETVGVKLGWVELFLRVAVLQLFA